MLTIKRILLFSLVVSPSSSADFSFNNTNRFNYTFHPNTNWTFVPCDLTFFGENACFTLTGNYRTVCIENTGGFSEGVCTCHSFYGFYGSNTENCNFFNATVPPCVSGPSACRNILPEAYFFALVQGLNSLYLAYSVIWESMMMLTAFKTKATGTREFNVRLTFLLFNLLAVVFLITWCISDIAPFILKSLYFTHSVEAYALGLMSIGLIGAELTLIIIWRRLERAIVLLKVENRKTLYRHEYILIFLFGAVLFVTISYFQFTGRASTSAKIGGAAFFIFTVYHSIIARPFVNMVRRKEKITRKFGREVVRCTKVLSLAYFSWVFSWIIL